MSDVPMSGLRFVRRNDPAVKHDENIRVIHVLQQLFATRQGREWRDVPLVDDPES